MLGAIIGDIVGSRFERHNHKSKDFELFTDRCRFTDDTAMTVAVAKALLECKGDYTELSDHTVRCMQEIGRKHPNAGYGQIFYLWLHHKNPGPYRSYGNGSAMRVSPVAYVAKTEKECIQLAKAVTQVSHDHPEGIKGAEAAALATWGAMRGIPKGATGRTSRSGIMFWISLLMRSRPKYRFDASARDLSLKQSRHFWSRKILKIPSASRSPSVGTATRLRPLPAGSREPITASRTTLD